MQFWSIAYPMRASEVHPPDILREKGDSAQRVARENVGLQRDRRGDHKTRQTNAPVLSLR